MSVVARFRVNKLGQGIGYTEVELGALYSPESYEDDPVLKEIRSFFEATPSGRLTMTIKNEAAAEHFQLEDEFYVRLEKIPTDQTVAAVTAKRAAEAEARAGG